MNAGIGRMAMPIAVRIALSVAVMGFVLVGVTAARAEPLSGRALVEALREGGHVIYFRHAQTDFSQRDHIEKEGDWTSCDPERVRQLSDAGRAAARGVGEAMRKLGIPVGSVRSSPYCRCVETAALLGVGDVTVTTELFNVVAEEWMGGKVAVVDRARKQLREAPPPGANTVLVAHGFLLRDATGDYPGEMGAAIYRPGGAAPLEAVATLTAADWEALVREGGSAE